MLFVELMLIRWLGSNVLYLSYFSNFVLLGSFLGIGIGFLRAKALPDLFPWAVIELAFLSGFVVAFPVTVNRSGNANVYFGFEPHGLPVWVILPIVFLATAIVMASIAQGAARVFARFEPLEAYRIDILGSLAGIVAFALVSFLSMPPVVWGAIAALLFLALYLPRVRLLQVVGAFAMLVAFGKESLDPQFIWSPYYRIGVVKATSTAYDISVNGVPHQFIAPMSLRRQLVPLYFAPYARIRSNRLRDVLIIGAGGGGDVAIALAAGAKHVDAVEIDPRLYDLGRRLDPDYPYQNPRVTVHINDGRAFLRQSNSSYDLILFALPDSLALVSGQSSLRLESYLFTREALQAARAHLNPGGAFGMYNYYREQWLVDRFAGTLEGVYGHAPCIDSASLGRFALLMVGLSLTNVACQTTWTPTTFVAPPATDDHPYPYLQRRSIPPLYLVTLLAILVISAATIRAAAGPLREMRGYADLFFMGAAFLLLETKSVVQFALLFGTTWFVNALVFIGILLSVLAAIGVARRFPLRNSTPLYAILFVSLGVAWAVNPEWLLALDSGARFGVATLLAFAPVFLANLVFADRFRAVESSTFAFGANLLGAMFGGIIEYSSMIVGYRSLLIAVALFYGLAFLLSGPVPVRLSSAVAPSTVNE